MRVRLCAGLAVVLLAAWLCGCSVTPTRRTAKRVRFSVLPAASSFVMEARLRPLREYLSQETGYSFEPVSAADYGDFQAKLETEQVEIALLNAGVFSEAKRTRGAYALAQAVEADGGPGTSGVIIVPAQSQARGLRDLRGEVIMVASRKAVAGYQAPRQLCLREGIDPETEMVVISGRTQDAVVRAVAARRVAAGFTSATTLKMTKAPSRMRQVRVLATTEASPSWVVAAFAGTDRAIAEKTKQALLKLDPARPEARDLLAPAGLAGFMEADREDCGK